MNNLKIAVFPEMWSCSYSFPENAAELEELAVSADGEFVLRDYRSPTMTNLYYVIPRLDKGISAL